MQLSCSQTASLSCGLVSTGTGLPPSPLAWLVPGGRSQFFGCWSLATCFVAAAKGQSFSKMGVTLSCQIVMEVTSHRLCHVLEVRSKPRACLHSGAGADTRREYQSWGSLGDHLSALHPARGHSRLSNVDGPTGAGRLWLSGRGHC